jgi:hypothetical protein
MLGTLISFPMGFFMFKPHISTLQECYPAFVSTIRKAATMAALIFHSWTRSTRGRVSSLRLKSYLFSANSFITILALEAKSTEAS